MKRTMMSAIATVAAAAIGASAHADDKTGVTDTTIKIGMAAPLTGFASNWGYPTVNGARMVFDEANAQGGINGRKIEVVLEDEQCDTQKSIAAAKKLIHRDKVFMVNAGVCSTATLPTREEYLDNKTPMMILVATMDKIVQEKPNDWIFRAYLPGSFDGVIMVDFLKTMPGVKKVMVVGHADEHANARYEPLIAGLKKNGLELAGVETIDYKVADATAQVLKVKAANPDAIALVARPAEAAVFLKDAYKLDLKTPMIGATVVDIENLAERIGDTKPLENFYVVSVYKGAVDSPEMAPYVSLLKKHYPNDKPQVSSFYATSGALAIVEALRKAGRDLSREKFVAELRKIKSMDGGPMACTITFTAENHDGCQSGTVWTMRSGKIVNMGSTWKQL